jgi:tRNA (guanine37-N1)-methyltransferase
MVRLLPGVLSEDSLEEESYSGRLIGKKEYPQYTRPEVFQELSVPKELLSGDPKLIERWKNTYL